MIDDEQLEALARSLMKEFFATEGKELKDRETVDFNSKISERTSADLHRKATEAYYNEVVGLIEESNESNGRLAKAMERIASVLEKKGTL